METSSVAGAGSLKAQLGELPGGPPTTLLRRDLSDDEGASDSGVCVPRTVLHSQGSGRGRAEAGARRGLARAGAVGP